ncbi:hypothetical protein CR513_17546, partial [Mucuna pruriens]
MERRYVTFGIANFSKLISCILDEKKLLIDVKDINVFFDKAQKSGIKKKNMENRMQYSLIYHTGASLMCLKGIKVSHGYYSNFRTLVSMQDLELVGLKSHYCHVLMQLLLPVAIHDVLQKQIKVVNPQKLNELKNEVIVILCQLEMQNMTNPSRKDWS